MNEQLDANAVIEEYRAIVANLVHQAAVSGALITKLRAEVAALKAQVPEKSAGEP